MKYFLFVLLFLACNILLAQNQATVDYLLIITKSKISDREKVNIYVKLAEEYRNSDSLNSTYRKFNEV